MSTLCGVGGSAHLSVCDLFWKDVTRCAHGQRVLCSCLSAVFSSEFLISSIMMPHICSGPDALLLDVHRLEGCIMGSGLCNPDDAVRREALQVGFWGC